MRSETASFLGEVSSPALNSHDQRREPKPPTTASRRQLSRFAQTDPDRIHHKVCV